MGHIALPETKRKMSQTLNVVDRDNHSAIPSHEQSWTRVETTPGRKFRANFVPHDVSRGPRCAMCNVDDVLRTLWVYTRTQLNTARRRIQPKWCFYHMQNLPFENDSTPTPNTQFTNPQPKGRRTIATVFRAYVAIAAIHCSPESFDYILSIPTLAVVTNRVEAQRWRVGGYCVTHSTFSKYFA